MRESIPEPPRPPVGTGADYMHAEKCHAGGVDGRKEPTPTPIQEELAKETYALENAVVGLMVQMQGVGGIEDGLEVPEGLNDKTADSVLISLSVSLQRVRSCKAHVTAVSERLESLFGVTAP